MAAISANPVRCTMPIAEVSGERQYIATYRVITNDVSDGPITARDATGIPIINSPFAFGNDFDNGAFARKYSASTQDESARKVWLVDVTYSSSTDRRNQEYQDDPTTKNAIISGGGLRYQRVVTKDINDVAIKTSADESLTDVLIDDSRPILRIQKNFATIDPDQFADFSNTLNSATFFGMAPRSWKMDAPEWEQRFYGDDETPFYAVTFRFQAKKETWDLYLIDRGSYYLDGSGNKTRFKGNGIVIPKGNLDGFGEELPDGDPLFELPFDVYRLKDFGLLGIPTSL